MVKLSQIKFYLVKLLYWSVALTIVFILFKSGTVYIRFGDTSVKIGIDLERKAPYMPEGIDESIRDSQEAIREADLILKDAESRGFLD